MMNSNPKRTEMEYHTDRYGHHVEEWEKVYDNWEPELDDEWEDDYDDQPYLHWDEDEEYLVDEE